MTRSILNKSKNAELIYPFIWCNTGLCKAFNKKTLLKFSEIIEKALTSIKARNTRVLSKGSNSRKLQKLIW